MCKWVRFGYKNIDPLMENAKRESVHYSTVIYVFICKRYSYFSAKGCGDLKKTIKAYKKVNLLILDEWLIRTLTSQESYNLLEIAESRCTNKSTIFCTQYEPGEWYSRITPTEAAGSPISEAIMNRIIHNSYEVLIDGKVSMRERHGLKATQKGGTHE